MTEYIKLVSDDYTTLDGFKWPIGETVYATGDRGQGLCTDEYLHVYDTEAMAALMAPNHVAEHYTRALVVEGESEQTDGTKHGLRRATVLREILCPTLTIDQRVAISIVAASKTIRAEQCRAEEWMTWARGWLSGCDRSQAAAAKVAWAPEVAWATPAAACAARAAEMAWSPAAAEPSAWAAAWAAAWADLPSICELVLSTPEDQWETLLEASDE